ncbi:hypothetical protein [Parapedobacter tibetensis]|uniref:hypothetical protein n=1 Tax=Parapedobacter tibetensis TaxID=2972951 RepID=UPI00214D663B|nr:hypothetical protein [Parapedobacter tibetensis]
MKKVIKVNLGVVMALFAAFGLMSFRLIGSATTVNQTPMYWYTQQSPNNWELESTTPSLEPDEQCREDEGDRCVKGFETQIPEGSISDVTEADQEYFRE